MFVLQLRQNINIGLLFSYMKHAHEYTNTHKKNAQIQGTHTQTHLHLYTDIHIQSPKNTLHIDALKHTNKLDKTFHTHITHSKRCLGKYNTYLHISFYHTINNCL